jgi:hypothetical protein
LASRGIAITLGATQTANLPSQPGQARATRKPSAETLSFEYVVGSHSLLPETATFRDLIAVVDRIQAETRKVFEALRGMTATEVTSNAGPLTPLLTALPPKSININVAGNLYPTGTLRLEVKRAPWTPEPSDALNPLAHQQGGAAVVDLEQHRRKRQAERDGDRLSDRARAAIRLVEGWLADESGYDEATWPKIERGLEEHRLSDRRLFTG